MATFINTSISWDGKETLDYFLRPLFIGKQPYETQGVRVIPNVRSKQRLNYFSAVNKMLKAYQKGFHPTTGSTYTQRVLEVFRMKAEAADDGLDFFQTVFEQGLKVEDWNNLEGTNLKEILVKIYQNAVKSDVYREFWHNTTAKETQSSGLNTGTADTDYNTFDGMWQLIFENAATTPGDLQIKRVAVSSGAVANVRNILLSSGSSANLVVTWQGVNYTEAYATSYTVTATNFAATHAAAFLIRGVTLTSSGANLILTSAIPGQPIGVPTFASASTIGGTITETTPNTAPSDLTAGQSEDIFKELIENSNQTLKGLPETDKYLLVSDSMLENYQSYNESLGTEISHVQLMEGIKIPSYRGIPIISLSWGVDMADFPHVSGENPAYSHRAIYTYKDNLVLGLNALSEYAGTDMWFNKDEEENRFRSKFEMGAQYVHNEFSTVAY